jgi:hypothetical protein
MRSRKRRDLSSDFMLGRRLRNLTLRAQYIVLARAPPKTLQNVAETLILQHFCAFSAVAKSPALGYNMSYFEPTFLRLEKYLKTKLP